MSRNKNSAVLVTGGAGYIGSHTVLELLAHGHSVVVLDDFTNSSPFVMDRLAMLAGMPVALEVADVRDFMAVRDVLARHEIDAVFHFAGLKAAAESCVHPLSYFDVNISGSIALLRAMHEAGVHQLVFSSSATVYGDSNRNPIDEQAARTATNPYGRSKLVVEDLIEDVCRVHPEFRAARLRYFNPIGAHPSGLIGEDPRGTPNNLMPYVCQVGMGYRESLEVFGDDYPTRDGTGVRDYLHVMDLARAHVDALNYLASEDANLTVNLGTGRGYSVLELVHAFEQVSGRPIPFKVVGRRVGDTPEIIADPGLAKKLLGWCAKYDLVKMCQDAWRWQTSNPHGYTKSGAHDFNGV